MITYWSLKYLAVHNLTFDENLKPEHYEGVPWDKGRVIPSEHHRKLNDVPVSLDWRDQGVVGPVHDQGLCNSCWAFAAAGSIEYWVRKQTPGAEVDVQAILDCAPDTYHCMGGLMENAFEYDRHYPLHFRYNEKSGVCTPSATGAKVTSFVAVERHIEDSLPYMIHKWGPVSVAVDFTKQHRYEGGIIKAKDCDHHAKHAVLVVGYTPDYWIIKNSKGTQWGEEGYAKLERHVGACGLETYAAVATGVSVD